MRCIISCIVILLCIPVYAGPHTHHHHEDSDAGWSFEYRVNAMEMDGLADGSGNVPDELLLGTMMSPGPYMMIPQTMEMEMHMFSAMRGIGDNLTLMVMAHYMDNTMKMISRMGATSEMLSSGPGDTMVSLHLAGESGLTYSLGVSIPTGSITETHFMPAMPAMGSAGGSGSMDMDSMNMDGSMSTMDSVPAAGSYVSNPYPMQLGSGTWDIMPTVIWESERANTIVGAALGAVVRTGKNGKGYRLGNRANGSAWMTKSLGQRVSATIKLEGESWGSIRGERKDLLAAKSMTPLADPDFHSGTRLGAGIKFDMELSPETGLFAEWIDTVYENLDGPQMSLDHQMVFGFRISTQ